MVALWLIKHSHQTYCRANPNLVTFSKRNQDTLGPGGKEPSGKISLISLFHRRKPSPNQIEPHSTFLPTMGWGSSCPRTERGQVSHLEGASPAGLLC